MFACECAFKRVLACLYVCNNNYTHYGQPIFGPTIHTSLIFCCLLSFQMSWCTFAAPLCHYFMLCHKVFHHVLILYNTKCYIVVLYAKEFQVTASIPTLLWPINSDAVVVSYLKWQGEQDRTWSPLICPVETLIPLLCEGAGAPGCSSSLLTARRQSSLLAFEVGADLKGPSSGFLQAWQQQ